MSSCPSAGRAAQSMSQAGQSLGQSGQSLSQNQSQQAQSQQQRAMEAMQNAMLSLEQAMAEARQDDDPFAELRKKLTAMADAQQAVLVTTHRINGDLNCAFNGVNVLCGRLILEPLKMLGCLILAAMICWRLLIVSLLVAPLAAYVLVRLTTSLRKANRRGPSNSNSRN